MGSVSFSNIKEYAISHLWVMPAAFIVFAIVLSQVMLAIDRAADLDSSAWYLFPGGTGGARELLSTIASTTFTFTALVFSITIVVLQLASSQLSARVMRVFLRDLGTQVVLAGFLALFTYTLFILREVQSEPEEFVPALSIWATFAMMLGAIGLFVYYMNHITQRVRPITIMGEIARESNQTIRHVYPNAYTPGTRVAVTPPGEYETVRSNGKEGVLTYINRQALRNAARDDGIIVKVVPAVGDFVPRGSELAHFWGKREGQEEVGLDRYFTLAAERTQQQDVGFGFRQLVDMAERALSPGINDPTTATQAIDHIHGLLRELSWRAIPDEESMTDPVLILHEPVWDDYVRLALEEIRNYGSSSIQITRRLRHLIEDLLAHCPEERRNPLLRELRLLDDAVERNFESESERSRMRVGSAQPNGPAAFAESGQTGPGGDRALPSR